ncbi:MAG TPA: hypothetical protein VF135_09005 [Terriglobales bacterium]
MDGYFRVLWKEWRSNKFMVRGGPATHDFGATVRNKPFSNGYREVQESAPHSRDPSGLVVERTVNSNEELQGLKEQEQQLEELRALLRPEHWPRIYELLKDVRQQIRAIERQQEKTPDKKKDKKAAS